MLVSVRSAGHRLRGGIVEAECTAPGAISRDGNTFVTCEVLRGATPRDRVAMAGTADERPSRLVRESRRFGVAAKALGARVRELRRARSWTLEQAAERMALDLKHLQKVEAGNPPLNVTLATLLRIADGLDVTIAELFAGLARKSRSAAAGDARPSKRSSPARRGASGSS